jgi:hypothetical protein
MKSSLEESTNHKTSTAWKRWVFVSIILLAGSIFIPRRIFFGSIKPEQNNGQVVVHTGSDSIIVDVTGWDSIKIDSFTKTVYRMPNQEDDSVYEDYLVKAMDSLMMSPDSGLVDSFIREEKLWKEKK